VERGSILMVGPGDINIATPLQLSMRWDITLLVQSVNLICAKKVYYSNRPKYFSLRQQQNHEQHFQNLFWTEWASLDGWKISYNFAFWNSK